MTNAPLVPSAQPQLVPVFTGTISGQPAQLVDARTLHAFLEVGRDFTNWIKSRIDKYRFTEHQDFTIISRSPELASGNRGAATDYHLTLDTAKELAMVENNDQGRAARRYFIECERRHYAARQPAAPGRALPNPESVHVLNSIRHNAAQLLGPWQPDLRMDYHDCIKALADVEKMLILCNGHGIQTGLLQQRLQFTTQMLTHYHSRMVDCSHLLSSFRFALDVRFHPTTVTNSGAKAS